jgi:tetratricopeptide (TPR) repeat protein
VLAQEPGKPPAQDDREKAEESNSLPVFPLFESEHFARADFNEFVKEAVDFIKKHPDSPQAELLMNFMQAYSNRATNYNEVFEPALEEILQGDLENGFNKETYQASLARYYRKRGLKEKADTTRTYDGYCLDCLMIGPFGSSYRACADVVYEPEKDLLENEIEPELVSKKYRGSDEFRGICWRKYPYVTPVRNPYVSPFSYLRPSGGLAYVLVQIKSPEARPVIFDINAGGRFKVWLNRSLLLDVDDSLRRETDSHLLAVNLVEGYNQVLIKLPGGSVRLGVRDLKGRLVQDIELEKELKIHPVKVQSDPVYKGDYNGGALAYYSKLVKEKPDNPVARCAYSLMLAGYGKDVEALEEAQEAVKLAKDNLFVSYFASLRYRNAPHYPRAMARNKAKSFWDAIIEADPKFVLAHEKIARYLTEDDKHEDAVKLINEKILDQDLANLGTHTLLMEIYNSMGWEREKMAQVKEIEKLKPASEWFYDYWAGYYSSHNNPEKAWELTKKSYELNKSGTWFLSRKASRFLERGRLDEALEIYLEIARLRPENYWTMYSIVNIYRMQGKYDRAIEQRKKMLELRPEDASDYQAIGELYHEWGKVDEAVEWYNKSLVLLPSNWTLRRYVQYLTGEDEDYSKPYALSDEEVMELIKSAPGKDAYPKASNLKVLDEVISKIQADGSESSYIRKVYKVLDISGKDRHATPYIRGEVLEVRTIQPDGTILEPSSVYGSFTMPSLKENVCIECRSRSDGGYGGSSRSSYESDRWFFQDEGYDEPMMKCRRVLIISKKATDKMTADLLKKFGREAWSFLDFADLKQNMIEEKGVVFTREEDEDSIVLSWTSDKMPRIEPEPFMPPRREILPNAYFISRRTWSDFTEALKERTFVYGVIPTKLIRKKAAEIVGDKTGQFEQVKALYGWCMTNIKGGYGGGEAHAILLEERGSRDTLFLAFLNVLGIPFDTVLVGPDPFTDPDTEWEIPRPGYYSRSLIRVKPSDHEPLYVSLATRYLPLGKIPEYCQGGPLYTPDEGITTRKMSRDDLDKRADKEYFEVDLETLICRARLTRPKSSSYGQKEYYKDITTRERKQSVERYANRYFPGAVLKKYELPELEKIGRMFEINFTCEVPNFLTVKKDGSIIAKTGIQPLEMQSAYADKSKREFDMVLRSINLDRTQVTIELGEKFEVVQLPTSVNIHNDFGTYVLTFSQDGSTITIKRRFTFLPQRIKTEQYDNFLEFCRTIDEAEVGRIILKEKEKTPEAPKPEDGPQEK